MLPFHPIRTSRRAFLRGTIAAVAALSLRSEVEKRTSPLVGFIKPFQSLPAEQIATIARAVGWNGVEVPVRAGGTIEPARVDLDLPPFVELLKAKGVETTILATDVADAKDAVGLKVLKTAARLGIQRYRIKHLRYDLSRPIAPQVDAFALRLRELAALNAELKLQGSVQNHSGATYLGAPVWDLWHMLRETDPASLGIYFDIAHATIEGGLSWPLEARLVQPLLTTVSVKDFQWVAPAKAEAKWDAKWCPLGEGMVDPAFFRTLQAMKFVGPISMHFEYEVGEGPKLLSALQRDTEQLRRWLS